MVQRTDDLLKEPSPFVLLRNLETTHVAYEVNAYADKPNKLTGIYSNLMQNILDRFGGTGVEIPSLQHLAIRKSPPTVKRRRRR